MNPALEAVLSASLSGSVVIILIFLLRFALKKAPKHYICMLWLLAAARLLVPLNIESELSLQPRVDRITVQREDAATNTVTELPGIEVDFGASAVVVPSVTQSAAPADPVTPEPSEPRPDIVNIPTADILFGVWAAVACGFLAYTALSYAVLKYRVLNAVCVDGNVYESDAVSAPFLLGYFRPRIYLPVGLSAGDLEHILAHERAHIRRLDNWIKLLGFLCVAVHWFNPLVWAAYSLLCRDMEMACDEAVVRDMAMEDRKAYSQALVNCAANMRLVSACPVAFGEVSVKARILKVLNYRRPVFWISLIAVAAIVFVSVCYMTDPAVDKAALLEQCRTALEEFQSTGSYHVWTLTEDYSLVWYMLDASPDYEEWNGNDREYLLIVTGPEGQMRRLHMGDRYLQRDINDTEDGETVDSGWYPTDWSGSSSFTTDTLADLNWEDYTVTVKSSRQLRTSRSPAHSATIDATLVTLRMKDEKRTVEREFYLDEAGKLFRIDDTYLMTNDPATVRGGLTQTYTESAADLLVYLDRCVRALQDLWQADAFFLETVSKQVSLPVQNWIKTHEGELTTRYENGRLTVSLEYGDDRFCREQTYYGSYLTGDSGWKTADSGVVQEDYPWFLTLDWENAGAYVLTASANEYYETVTVMVPGQVAVLEVYFDAETGSLDHIQCDGLYYALNTPVAAERYLNTWYRQAAGLEAEPESLGAQRCREALEAMETGSYTVVQKESTGKQAYTRVQVFKVGENQLIHCTGTERSYLRLDGKDYVTDGDGWTETALGDFSCVEDWWLGGLKWDPDRMFVYYDLQDRVIVTVRDESLPKGFYILEFDFDGETGELINLTRSYDSGTPENWMTHSSVLTIRYPEPDSTEAYIRSYFENLEG